MRSAGGVVSLSGDEGGNMDDGEPGVLRLSFGDLQRGVASAGSGVFAFEVVLVVADAPANVDGRPLNFNATLTYGTAESRSKFDEVLGAVTVVQAVLQHNVLVSEESSAASSVPTDADAALNDHARCQPTQG